MNFKFTFKCLVFSFMAFCLAFSVQAQNNDFIIYGKVQDVNTGVAMVNQMIYINDSTTGGTYSNTLLTDSSGFFRDTVLNGSVSGTHTIYQVSTYDCANQLVDRHLSNRNGSRNSGFARLYICDSATVPPACQADFSWRHSQSSSKIQFSNRSTSIAWNMTNYLWTFGDGDSSTARNPWHTYAAAGTYVVCLTVSNSLCSDTYCDTVTVTNPQATCSAAFTAHQSSTIANRVYFANQSTGHSLNYLWTFGDGDSSTHSTPRHDYAGPGTYMVCLTVSNASGCSDTFCDTVIVTLPAGNCNAYFRYNDTGLNVNFDNRSSGSTNYNWDFGDGNSSTQSNPNHTYASRGTYTVCLTVSDSNSTCVDTFCRNIQVDTIPFVPCSADFSWRASSHTINRVFFNNNSTGGSSYLWTFGDGDSSYHHNPRHDYAASGTYIVCLTVSNASGCSDTFCDTVVVNNGSTCTADFSWRHSSNSSKVYFTNKSSGLSLDYLWTFGDGDSSRLSNPSHTYAMAGTYVVCLTVSNAGGCSDTYCDTVVVTNPQAVCTADYSWRQSSQSNNVYFTNKSSGFNLDYLWTFGDGDSSRSSNPRHNYAMAGTYVVCLTISNASGCSDTYCDTITVINHQAVCSADFSWRQSSQSNNVYFNNNSSGFNLDYLWTFGDGDSSISRNPTHNYAMAGTYVVCLTISNASGCSDTFCDTITVTNHQAVCSSDYSWRQSSQTNNVYFTNKSSGIGLDYLWTFGDGDSSVSRNPTHNYAMAGTYFACLTISNASGCSDTFCDTITVTNHQATCSADFKAFNRFGGTYFSNRSSGFQLNYLWTFGDGDSSMNTSPFHQYAANGTYVVCLNISNSSGCSDSYCDTVVVSNVPTCSAAFTDSLAGLVAHFTNNSTGATSYRWDFGDGNSSMLANPIHTYARTGIYRVCLTAIDTANNCVQRTCSRILARRSGFTGIIGSILRDGFTADYGLVYLVEHDSVAGTLTAIDTVALGFDGSYVFDNVPAGQYLVKAQLLRRDHKFRRYLPTYFGDELLWNDASYISVPNNSTYDINLTRGWNTPGPGFIGGLISQGAGFTAGGALEDVSVILLDDQDAPVMHAISDGSGNYDFDSLAYGTYKVLMDVPGLQQAFYMITIAPNNQSSNGNDFTVSSTSVVPTSIQTGTTFDKAVKIYPNPTRNNVQIEFSTLKNTSTEILVRNVIGKTLKQTQMDLIQGNHNLTIDLSDLAEGMYFIEIHSGDDRIIKRIIKTN